MIYSGVTFDGDTAFADETITSVGGDGVEDAYADPDAVSGAPDWINGKDISWFSLGLPGEDPNELDDGLLGSVTVNFTANSPTTSSNSDASLVILRIGNVVERSRVEISTNNSDWILLKTSQAIISLC